MLVGGLAGCDEGGSDGSGGGGNASEGVTSPVFEEDAAASQTKAVSSTQGATFETPSGEGTATVMVMPGTFPDGTTLTFTPLKDSGDGAVAPGFGITSDSAERMALPAFVVFEFPGDVPETDGIVLYEDDSEEAVPLYVTEAEEGGSTFIIAEVTHFTVFRFEPLNEPRPTRENKKDAYQAGFKEWAIKVNDRVPIDDGLWKGENAFEMDVRSPVGDIFGPYNGQASYSMTMDISGTPALTGHAGGTWAGPMNFSPAVVKKYSMSYKPTLGGDPVKPGLGFWLMAEGTFSVSEVTPFEIKVTGMDLAGGWASPVLTGEVPVELLIHDGGALVTVGENSYKGFVIGTLE